MGKWTTLRRPDGTAYPDAPPANPDYWAKVVAKADSYHALDFKALIEKYESTRDALERAEDAKKAAGLEEAAAELAVIRRLGDMGLDRVTGRGRNYTVVPEPYFKVEDKSTVLAYFQEHEPGALTVHDRTLQSRGKRALEGDADMPPGLGIFLKRRLTPTKST